MDAGRRLIVLVLMMLGCNAALATLSVYMPHETVADRAVLIVEGTVARVASGYDPETDTVATYVTLDVTVLHRGPAGVRQVTLREPGGTFAGISNVLDAVPVYEVGEQVMAFLEPSADGALRTTGMFFGKYALSDDRRTAFRDLEGRGLILGRFEPEQEAVSAADLAALSAGPRLRARRPRIATRPGWAAAPPEMGRLVWDGDTAPASDLPTDNGGSGIVDLRSDVADPQTGRFVTLSSGSPARWYAVDSGAALTVDVEPGGNPLADDAAAVGEMERAMAAWTAVPESRLTLQLGNGNADFTGSHFTSPADTYYAGVNIILFDDPYNDISDPSGCSGVLAIGGYWRSGSTGAPVNGVTYNKALAMYVIFNNNFQCFLGNPDNLAEVATHELGHSIGLGHSAVPDAVMRSSAYGGSRGPRLGDDDMDAAHCVYPHTLSLTSPAGGESFIRGDTHGVTWSSTAESGPDTGQLDLEFSDDNGVTWQPLAGATANDGYYDWNTDVSPGAQYRVRAVRHNRVSTTPAPWPSACSSGSSSASFTVTAQPLGGVPDGSTGQPLILGKALADLTFSWGDAGNAAVDNYAIYRGDLDALRSGSWNHLPATCNAGTDLYEELPPAGASSFYLVAPLSGSTEGNLGTGSDGQVRPASTSSCGTPE